MASRKNIRRRQRQQLNRQTIISMVTVLCVLAALFLIVLVKGIELTEKNAAYEETIAALQQEIAEEEQRAEDIEEYSEYINSEEYIEKIAKERLGLINDDEIIFYSE